MSKPLIGKIVLALSLALSLVVLSSISLADSAKEWTVLVYLNGHNSLDSFSKMNIDGMSQVGSDANVNIIVQWASIANGKTKRLYITKGGFDVVEEMAPADMGDYNTLVDFAKWAAAKYPAKKYMVDVWNHGSGWHLQDINVGFHVNDISYDDTTGHKITTEQLGVALGQIAQATGQKVELYASDACLMAMGEVAGEMTNSVKYFGGSQETEPGEGWPYQTFLGRLAAKPTMNGGDLAVALSEEYQKSYSGGVYGNKEVTFSAWDLSKMDRFYAAVRALATELKGLDANQLKSAFTAIDQTQAFALYDYKDLADYTNNLKAANVRVGDHALGEVTASMKELLLSVNVTDTYARAHGISVWLPSSKDDLTTYSDRYANLTFNKQTGWLDFLKLAVQ